MDTLDLVAKAGLNVVSLPMCNLYLQDRQADRTPRRRGITLVHEMKARGINVSFACDNTRDPFYAYGDLDMIEVMRQATRIGHLDHSGTDWPQAFLATRPRLAVSHAPFACARRARRSGHLQGARLDRAFRPPAIRPHRAARNGREIDTALPDYAELDHLMEARHE